MIQERLFALVRCTLCSNSCGQGVRAIHSSLARRRGEDRKQLAASMPKRDDGAEGEKSVDIDTLLRSKDDMFPDLNLPNKLFDGTQFKDLPIVNIKATKNNTIINLTTAKGVASFLRSCGMEGFKNTRKGTNIAAQATAIGMSMRLLDAGVKTVRVRVQGLGPGRMSAIKGLQMGGVNIVSVTDNTHVSWNPPRPRKQRRL